MNEFIFFTFFITFFICLICFLLSTKGRELFYGGKIIKEWNTFKNKRGCVSSSIKISTIEIAPTLRMVGFDISQSVFRFYNMSPISFPVSEALELARVLNEAATSQISSGERKELNNSIKTFPMKIHVENTLPNLLVSITMSRIYSNTVFPIHLSASEASELARKLEEAATLERVR